jgi:uncharacterized protein (UPF0210 family)
MRREQHFTDDPQGDAAGRRRFLRRAGGSLLAAAFAAGRPRAARAAARAGNGRPFNLRAITAGVNVTAGDHVAVLGETRAFLDRARASFEKRDYTVQTRRITTRPHAEFLDGASAAEASAVFASMKAAAGDAMLAIGPGIVTDSHNAAAIDRALAAATAGIASTVVIAAPDTGLHYRAVEAAAEIIHRLASPEPMRNFSFAAIASVPPGTPFFPGGYHGAPDRSFAIGTEGASLVMKICAEVGSVEGIGEPLLDAYGAALEAVEAVAREVEAQTGWRFAGIDPTPAQWGALSIGTAVEHLIGAPFGSPGTLAACRALTAVIRRVPVTPTGYRGLFLPPLEDSTLALRAHDHYDLGELLACSAVCGTGLDAVALAGDAAPEAIRRILLDVAQLSLQLGKPLTARLLPIPGRKAGERSGALADLFEMKVLGVR